tara:strand:- start:386 stop:1117 length:732 start_codon:yes stop_codon:yes gene_type:complete
MKIAVTFWGTQSYLNYLPEWYDRNEKYFLEDIEKRYFVFTDGELEGTPDNITTIKIPHYGFPETFHKTFEEMLKIKNIVSDFDWLVSIDADLYVQENIEYDQFFDESKKYFGVHHPCHFVGFPPHNQKPGSYDTNPLSNAYINENIMDMKIYYQGCLWGGQIPQVFDMMERIDEWTKQDVPRNTVGKYYEESYLNKWFLTHRKDVHTLDPDYAYPEMFKEYCDFPNKMMHLSKDNKSLDNNQW